MPAGGYKINPFLAAIFTGRAVDLWTSWSQRRREDDYIQTNIRFAAAHCRNHLFRRRSHPDPE